MITYSIEAAFQSGMFERVVVSTDDSKIAEVATLAGAEISLRPAELAGDEPGLAVVCMHELSVAQQRDGEYDVLACLLATAPMRNSDDIEAVVNLIEPGIVDFSLAVTHYDLPPHQALKYCSDGFLEAMWPDLIDAPAGDIPEMLVDNGSTYAMSVKAFRQSKSLFGPKLKGYIMERSRSIDIDEKIDLELAEYFAEKGNK